MDRAGEDTSQEDTIARLTAENERLTLLLESDMTFRELEMKIHDGTFDLRTLSSPDDTTTHAVLRFVAALCLNMLLGEEREEPENYRSCEFHIKPAGEVLDWRLFAEVVKPGGKSSHEIRRELEAALSEAQSQLANDTLVPNTDD